jgi:hypothetical protein
MRPRVDGGQSRAWRKQGAGPPAKTPSAKRRRADDDCAVLPEDLDQLDGIRELLHALNDAYAGAQRIQELVSKVPVLSARCIRRAKKRSTPREHWNVTMALTLIGNIGLESELLDLLEDLTTMRADLDDAAARR